MNEALFQINLEYLCSTLGLNLSELRLRHVEQCRAAWRQAQREFLRNPHVGGTLESRFRVLGEQKLRSVSKVIRAPRSVLGGV